MSRGQLVSGVGAQAEMTLRPRQVTPLGQQHTQVVVRVHITGGDTGPVDIISCRGVPKDVRMQVAKHEQALGFA